MQTSDHPLHAGHVADLADLIQQRRKWFQTELVDPRFICARAIEIADQLLD